MANECTVASLADAAKLLSIEPTQYDHFIQIVDGRVHWQEHQRLLDVALALLAADESYSLRHMPPPPLWTESGNEAGRAWRTANPHHPMADDCRASARREAGCEILTWARFVPQVFSSDRRRTLYRCLLDCDAGIRLDLLRAVGFLGADDAVEALTEFVRFESESPNCKAMAQVLIGRLDRSASAQSLNQCSAERKGEIPDRNTRYSPQLARKQSMETR